ncbi:hypothetical protein AAY81_08655 [Denitrobacterium detoxificans]|uniref:Uncharacterized membrane protein YczE n=1 Tax=Denitrobacterium detoxificans TaxID=79604 RepID=A0A172RZQ3_9ACTN|nr:DUF6198 family protein [Denitrobacterium detoxificans]ANE23164.1 hypothetical protein AAY81_08655 [Denitrobacterium detoxificans]SEO55502.1 Uncharacterized membrane protein YczE [Denitrobacterium detoxificans]
MKASEIVYRYFILFLGIFCISFGVALFTKSGLGTSAISALPYTLSLVISQFSYGTWVAAFNIFLVVLQAALTIHEISVREIVQEVIFALAFGSVVDFSMFLLGAFNPEMYAVRLLGVLLSSAIIAFGAYLTLISRVGVMAGDGFTNALVKRTGKSFALMRVISDTTMAILALVLCLLLVQGELSVREGTVIAALLTGTIVGFYSKYFGAFERFILPKPKTEQAAK